MTPGEQEDDSPFHKSQLYASSYLHSETLVNFAGLFDVNTQLKKSILGSNRFEVLIREYTSNL